MFFLDKIGLDRAQLHRRGLRYRLSPALSSGLGNRDGDEKKEGDKD
jgi:hypothetical protein